MTGRRREVNHDIDSMMNDILDALDVIKDKMPNGEIKSIQDKIENIESAQEDMHEDLRLIKKQLLDPEDGIVVRVNKNTEFRKRKEDSEKTFQAIIDEHKELMSWKSTVTKILWILFTAVAGILVSIVFKSMQN
jgi:16S rRNA C1402 N4-methylase RsmH